MSFPGADELGHTLQVKGTEVIDTISGRVRQEWLAVCIEEQALNPRADGRSDRVIKPCCRYAASSEERRECRSRWYGRSRAKGVIFHKLARTTNPTIERYLQRWRTKRGRYSKVKQWRTEVGHTNG